MKYYLRCKECMLKLMYTDNRLMNSCYLLIKLINYY